jgi:hypothetical protein
MNQPVSNQPVALPDQVSTALAMYPRVADVVPDFGQRCRHWWPSQVPEPGPLS